MANSKNTFTIVVLISGNGSNLQALIDDARAHPQCYRIAAVISNRADAYGLQRAKTAAIPSHAIDHRTYSDRTSFDRALSACIDQYKPDLVVLAGFMRILTAEFVRHYQDHLVNIHPSLLPKFQGLNTHQRALDAKELLHGATVHLVTPSLDDGPSILQVSIPIEAGEQARHLAQRVLAQEHKIYPLAVQWFAEGKLEARQNRLFLNNVPLTQPLQFNPQTNNVD